MQTPVHNPTAHRGRVADRSVSHRDRMHRRVGCQRSRAGRSLRSGADADGAGVCVVSGPQSETSAGLNLVGGANLDLGAADAFVQLRLTLADGMHLSLTAGAFPRLD
jgi:hypothetical protein